MSRILVIVSAKEKYFKKEKKTHLLNLIIKANHVLQSTRTRSVQKQQSQ